MNTFSNEIGLTRRSFLNAAALTGVAAVSAGLAGCAAQTSEPMAETGTVAAVDSIGDWLGEAPATPDTYAAEYEADIVVCGLGIAGVSALRAAAEAGATVIGFDKADATRCSNEICAFGSQTYASRYPDVAAQWDDARAIVLNAVSEGCLYRNDTRILRR